MSLWTPHRQCPRVLFGALRQDLAAPRCPSQEITPLLGAHAARHHLLFGAYHACKRKRILRMAFSWSARAVDSSMEMLPCLMSRKTCLTVSIRSQPLYTWPYIYLSTPPRIVPTQTFHPFPQSQLLSFFSRYPVLQYPLRFSDFNFCRFTIRNGCRSYARYARTCA